MAFETFFELAIKTRRITFPANPNQNSIRLKKACQKISYRYIIFGTNQNRLITVNFIDTNESKPQ